MKNAILGGLLLVLSVGLFAAEKPRDWKPSPRTLTALQDAGEAAGLPIGLAECLAYEESRFKYWIVARGGKDLGLMQINKQYEVYLADRFFPGGYKAFRWWVIEDNATLGCNYLAYLVDYFGGSVYLALVAYNWGSTNLKEIKAWSDVPKMTIKYADSILKHLDSFY